MNEQENKLVEELLKEVKTIRIALAIQIAIMLVLFFILASSLRW